MSHHTLIRAEALQSALAAGTPVVIVDTSFDLADPAAGRRAYEAGHLPGAHYLHLEDDLSGPKQGADGRFRGRHPLPARQAFAQRVAQLGIVPGRQVVAVDRQGGMMAARLWWLLRWLGHDAVAVLDGGVAAWEAAGGAQVTAQPESVAGAAPYPAVADSALAPTLDAASLAARLGRDPLIDARAPERFRGDVEPLDAQAGHIPGALNRFFKDNLEAGGRFKSAQQLHDEFVALIGETPASRVVHQCGSGVSACHNLLAMEYAGLGGSQLYPGSWSEWSSDPARPVARGS